MSADYEVPVTTVADAQGRALRVVRHYTDGIILGDPVKAVVYEGDQVVCETPYFREVVVRGTSAGSLAISGIEFFGFPLNKTWLLQDRTLVPAAPVGGHCRALLATLRSHWLGYLLSILLCSLAAISIASPAALEGTWADRPGLLKWAGGLWMFLDFMYGPLCPFLILELSLLFFLPLVNNAEEALRVAAVLAGTDVLVRLYLLAPVGLFHFKEQRKRNMSEARWHSCGGPRMMLECLILRGPVSDRKLRLFSVACCRRIWHLLPDESARAAVLAAERFADGQADAAELAAARQAASGLWQGPFAWPATAAEEAAREVQWATAEALSGKPPGCYLGSDACDSAALAGSSGNRTSKICRYLYEEEKKAQAALLRDLFGPLPFRPVHVDPSWRTPEVLRLARVLCEERDFGHLPILADALEAAGCVNEDVLRHCREPGVHTRGCWVLDLLLDKE
jgi:hypothetical protein